MTSEVLILTTGGTIDKVYFDDRSSFQVGASTVDSILRQANVSLAYSVKELFRKDSLDLTPEDRSQIKEAVLAAHQKHILITHGTDTMTESAIALGAISDKTVVFTGSMQPACFTSTDAIFNVGAAWSAMLTMKAGVYVCMQGKIFDPKKVKKNRDNMTFEDLAE